MSILKDLVSLAAVIAFVASVSVLGDRATATSADVVLLVSDAR